MKKAGDSTFYQLVPTINNGCQEYRRGSYIRTEPSADMIAYYNNSSLNFAWFGRVSDTEE